MLCCGLFALLAAAALGAWRLLNEHRRVFLGLAATLLAAGPVAALAMNAAVKAEAGGGAWAGAMRRICGDRHVPTLEAGVQDR
jgi:hypothetical protein